MTTAKQERSPSQIHSDSLLPYLLISLLIHGLVAVVIGFQGRSLVNLFNTKSQLKTKQQNDAPIEFVVVPPQQSPIKPPETKRRAINNSVAKGKVTPKLPPNLDASANQAIVSSSKTSPIAKTQPTEVVKPTPSKLSKPEPVKPTQPATSNNSVSKRSDSAPQPTSAGEPILPQPSKPNSSVATRIPSQPKPIPSTPSNPTDSGAASLLGTTYQRSIKDDSGSSFFNLEANASQDAPYAQLEAQQHDLAPYFNEIRRRVKRNWQPESPEKEQFTILNFEIQRNGQITGLRIAKTSGNEQIDREALEAVQKSAPFDALPQSYKRDRLEIQFSFNIYIHQGLF